ncbi:MAG: DUF2255 family protein [Acidimicrobiales bacterium]
MSTFEEAAGAAREVRVVVASGGQEVRTPIWVVTVGPFAYVRSYRGATGRWYRYASASSSFAIEIGDDDVVVQHVPVTDPVTLEQVSAAYLTKYAGESETPDMVTPEVVATTLRLVPIDR